VSAVARTRFGGLGARTRFEGLGAWPPIGPWLGGQWAGAKPPEANEILTNEIHILY
jgi:hypothetical protein